MNVTFRQLRVFAEVARNGSMARAAEALHLTPPAVSMQVKELEGQVGLPLFDRHGKSVSLSMAGEYFLVHARKLLAALKEADDAMKRLKHVEHGVLTIGMVATAKYFVPHLLALFRQEHPGVDVRLRLAANREQLAVLLDGGEVDLAVMGRPPRELATRSEAFATHPLAFVAAADHPLHATPHAPPALLAGLPFIARESGSGTRAAMERFFAEHRVQPQIVMELASNETIKQSVIAGLGLGFMSLHGVDLELRAGVLRVLDIEGTPVLRSWHVVHLGSRVLAPAAEAFRYFLIEQGDTFLRRRSQALQAALAPSAQGPLTS
jgi:LysR family transcriptional regulator, low CO2-responsive transcriptional regulator